MALRFGYYENGTCCTQFAEALQHSTRIKLMFKWCIFISYFQVSIPPPQLFTASLKPKYFTYLPPPHPVPKH